MRYRSWRLFAMERPNVFWEKHGESEACPTPPRARVWTHSPLCQERAIAVADFDCKQELDNGATYQKVQFAMEQEFVDTHQAEIETTCPALEGAGP